MNQQNEGSTIEVEVLEVDGVPFEGGVGADVPGGDGSWRDWTAWQGRVRSLDPRWWPLWVLIGIFVFTLLVTIGLAVGILVLAGRIFFGVTRVLLRWLNPDRAISRG